MIDLGHRAWLSILLILAGCASVGQPPVAERSPVFSATPEFYSVTPGDTLYSIAWRFDLDFRTLARLNALVAPYTIFAGQQVRLVSSRVAIRPIANDRAQPRVDDGRSRWSWPTQARLSARYSNSNSGLNFKLTKNTQVTAAGAGEVVYAGTGLGGYRHLVIIKHDERFLSAYSLNQPGRVAEGERLAAGDLIATMADVGRSGSTLHFEIRRDGIPVDPLSLLQAR